MELDYHFVRTLAQYTVCNSVDGLILHNKYVDPAIIRYVESALKANVDLRDLELDLSVRYPNKKKEHRSLEALQLLVELKSTTPSYTHQQLNHKHINMWTRSIVPFRHLHEGGTLFKGKTVFHKDCKRFAKALMEVLSYTVYSGPTVGALTSIFGKKAGQGSKLLEQWLNAMFEIHGTNMLDFMVSCALRLARTYVETKLSSARTADDLAILRESAPRTRLLLAALKEYLAKITEYEGLDSMAAPFAGVANSRSPSGPAMSVETSPTAYRISPAPATVGSGASSANSVDPSYSPIPQAFGSHPYSVHRQSAPSTQPMQAPAPLATKRNVYANAAAAGSSIGISRSSSGSNASGNGKALWIEQSRPADSPVHHHTTTFQEMQAPPHSSRTMSALQPWHQDEHRRQVGRPVEWQRLPPPSALMQRPFPHYSAATLPPMAADARGRTALPGLLHRSGAHQPYQRQSLPQLQRYRPYHSNNSNSHDRGYHYHHYHYPTNGSAEQPPSYREENSLPMMALSPSPSFSDRPKIMPHHPQSPLEQNASSLHSILSSPHHYHDAGIGRKDTAAPAAPASNTVSALHNVHGASTEPGSSRSQHLSEPQQSQTPQVSAPMKINSVFK
ncbi:hypothetical protein H4217_000507 [Coemansia sp. RSA 1939]|nr:hypothetical protein H4217_000507 [Coemansia sp. RSA 1939]KAJ2617555.1 hypothetical protein EV177_000518 [Coemansia sp. RSA 1804]